jgi:thiamine-monophosphate kinase
VYEDKIPLDPTVISGCEEFGLDSTLVAMSGGEDYELLFTIKQEDYRQIKGNPNLTVIGHMTDAADGAALIARNNARIPVTAQGWNALNTN